VQIVDPLHLGTLDKTGTLSLGVVLANAERDSKFTVELLKAQGDFAEAQLRQEDEESQIKGQRWKKIFLRQHRQSRITQRQILEIVERPRAESKTWSEPSTVHM